MRKRIISIFLVLVLCLGLFSGSVFAAGAEQEAALQAASSAPGANRYGHSVVYHPQTSLYSGNTPVSVFDAKTAAWNLLDAGTRRDFGKAWQWLSRNNYLLNRFGSAYSGSYDMRTYGNIDNNGWTGKIKGPGKVDSWKWDGCVIFTNLLGTEALADSNMASMVKDRSLQLLLSYKARSVQTRWGLFRKSNDTVDVYFGTRRESYSGGGVAKYNNDGTGPNISGGQWLTATNNFSIRAVGKSDRDSSIDSSMYDGILVARDVKGPTIQNITVTADAEGSCPIPDGKLTLDTIKTLKDRTIYFQVEWSEPVLFDSTVDPSALTLQIETIGQDGTSGDIAEAAFLSYAPSRSDSTPVMTFEYRVLDPYDAALSGSALELALSRGYLYSFTTVNVSGSVNKTLYYHITDIAGNPFGGDVSGNRPAAVVSAPVSKTPTVDLRPFAAENIRFRQASVDKVFVETGDVLEIDLVLNKNLRANQALASAPAITLNLSAGGTPVTLQANSFRFTQKAGEAAGSGSNTVHYEVRITDSMIMNGKSLQVTEIGASELKDASGYTLMTYRQTDGSLLKPVDLPAEVAAAGKTDAYLCAPDRAYKVDHAAPQITVSAAEADHAKKIFVADAVVSDDALDGCTAAFFVSLPDSRLRSGADLRYQFSTDGSYDAAGWKSASGTETLTVSAPLIGTGASRHAYLVISLPADAEIGSLRVKVQVTDEAGNTGSAEGSCAVTGIDTFAPSVTLTPGGERGAEKVQVKAVDVSAVTYAYAWTDTDETEQPALTQSAGGLEVLLDAPSDVPAASAEHPALICRRRLWLQAKDAFGNAAPVQTLDMSFDRTVAAAAFTENDDGTITIEAGGSRAPDWDLHYWFLFIEEASNYIDPATGIDYGSMENYFNALLTGYDWNDDFLTDIYPMFFDVNREIFECCSGVSDDEALCVTIDPYDYYVYQADRDDERGKWFNFSRWDSTTRPVTLLVGVALESSEGQQLVFAHQLDRYQAAPEVSAVPVRYSSQRPDGEGIELVRTPCGSAFNGLYNEGDAYDFSNRWWEDYETNGWWEGYETNDSNDLNVTQLNGYGQLEMALVGDPVTDLDRLDLGSSRIILRRVAAETSYMYPNKLNYAYKTWEDVRSWTLQELLQDGLRSGNGSYGDLTLSSPYSKVHTLLLDLDPADIDEKPYVKDYWGDVTVIYYEILIEKAYTNGNTDSEEKLTSFLFWNEPDAIVNTLYIDNPDGSSYPYGISYLEDRGVKLIRDENGADITENVPILWYSLQDFESDEGSLYVELALDAGSLYGIAQNTPRQVEELGDTPLKILFRHGTSPDSMTESEIISRYGTSDYLQLPPCANHRTERVYYQICWPDAGWESDIMVFDLARDDDSPVIELSVSETERIVNEVQVKVTACYDVHEENGILVTDTDFGGNLDCVHVLQKLTQAEIDAYGEDIYGDTTYYYDPESEDWVPYIFVYPDENGIYHLTNPGVVTADAYVGPMSESDDEDDLEDDLEEDDEEDTFVPAIDLARNEIRYFVVNGVPRILGSEEGPEAGYLAYYITNIDNMPPRITDEPTVTVDENTGSILLHADTDGTQSEIRLSFDSAYLEALGLEDDAEFPLTAVPGLYSWEVSTVEHSDGYEEYEEEYEDATELFGDDYAGNALDAVLYVSPGQTLTALRLILLDSAGNRFAYEIPLESPAIGAVPAITRKTNGAPTWNYGDTLRFNVPVLLPEFGTEYAASHSDLPLTTDGLTPIRYIDLFGNLYTESVNVNVGSAFSHTVTLYTADGSRIPENTMVAQDVIVRVVPEGGASAGSLLEKTFTKNGIFTYTLIYGDLEPRTYTRVIDCIDKAAPQAQISTTIESSTDADGTAHFYSVTCAIEGFDKENVVVIDKDGRAAPASVTFDANSAEKTHTFFFRDALGNSGSETVSAADLVFENPNDNRIASYRLIYTANGTGGILAALENGAVPDIDPVNCSVYVQLKAYNAAGTEIPFTVSAKGTLPEGTLLFTAQQTLCFTGESAKTRTASLSLKDRSGKTTDISVSLPGGCIDLTAPTASVVYPDDLSGSSVVLRLRDISADVPADGVQLSGSYSDGRALTLQKDGSGYFVTLSENGTGAFLLTDHAGNRASLGFGVACLDRRPPELIEESWSGAVNARTAEQIRELLSTPTNTSIKLFFTFDEPLASADVTAYDRKTGTKLDDQRSYVAAEMQNNLLTVEFLQNCQARITASDLRGNTTILWRPEDGPITVIDRQAPEILNESSEWKDNCFLVTYRFSEEVMLLQDSDSDAREYRTVHTVKFEENGVYTMTFADRAGNVVSVYKTVTDIDESTPSVKLMVVSDGKDRTLSAEEAGLAGNRYTAQDLLVFLAVTDDETPDGIQIRVTRQGSANLLPAAEKANTVNGIHYTHVVTLEENGTYEISVSDRWGHTQIIPLVVSVIDRTPPTISMASTKTVEAALGTDEASLRERLLEGVTAEDAQSGANGGVTLDVVLTAADLTVGTHSVTITAADRLGNVSTRQRSLRITAGDVKSFAVNGLSVNVGDVAVVEPDDMVKISFTMPDGSPETLSFSYARGYLTGAEMKNGRQFDPAEGFRAALRGYYTVLIQSSERQMNLIYVYVN